MTLIRETEWEACLLEPRRDPGLERSYRREAGRIPGSAPYFSPVPWLGPGLAGMYGAAIRRVHVPDRIADLAGLAVSQDNSCRYCFAVQRTVLRLMGLSEERIRGVEQDFLTADLDPRERAAIDFARRMSRSNPLPDAGDLQRLREAGLSEPEVLETIAVVAVNCFFNRLSTFPALAPEPMEALPDRWYMRLITPLVGPWYARRIHRRRPVARLSASQRSGPFGRAVAAIDGTHAAPAIRRLLDDMQESAQLSPRAQGLIFAVIARALGCERSEAEARRMLAASEVKDELVDDVLAHLRADELDSLETVAVQFARETVWYKPAAIQRRAREIRDAMPRIVFLELIVVTSIANAVCRLGIADALPAPE